MPSIYDIFWGEWLACGAAFPMFLNCDTAPFSADFFGSGPVINEFTLYTFGLAGQTNVLSLYLQGSGYNYLSTLPLFLYNNTQYSSMTMFIKGTGVNDGFAVYDGSLNLYIQCGTGEMIPFYMLGGPQPSALNEMSLYLLGHIATTGSMNLVLPQVYDIKTASLKLYTHGF